MNMNVKAEEIKNGSVTINLCHGIDSLVMYAIRNNLEYEVRRNRLFRTKNPWKFILRGPQREIDAFLEWAFVAND